MRIVFLFVLFLGICLAGFAVYVTMQRFNEYDTALAKQQKVTVQQIETVQVIVAARDLEYGEVLTDEDIRFATWPAEFQPDAFFSTSEDLFSETEDRVVLRDVGRNEPITEKKITGFGLDAGVASRLSEGKRAFTIKVDVASGVSGFLSPSDRVDVFWTGNDRGESVTRLIIENLKLLAVDQIANENRDRAVIARTVTAEATPEEAAILAQAQSTGRLTLSLRGISDTSDSGEVEISQYDITGRQDLTPEPEAPAAPQKVIRIRRGNEVEEVTAQ